MEDKPKLNTSMQTVCGSRRRGFLHGCRGMQEGLGLHNLQARRCLHARDRVDRRPREGMEVDRKNGNLRPAAKRRAWAVG